MDSSRPAESIRVYATKARSEPVQNSNREGLFALQFVPTDLWAPNRIAKTSREQVTLGVGAIPLAQDGARGSAGISFDVLEEPLVDWPR
jgi:hypothetical protein